jgi:deoxyribonuclease IV
MTFYFGAHVSVTKLIQSLTEIRDLGGNFAQIFVSSTFGKYNANLINKYDEKKDEIRSFLEENDMKLVIHSPYTLNFGQDMSEVPLKTQLICDELQVAHNIGAIGCVIHVGKHLKLDESESEELMHYNISHILNFIKRNKLNSKLILETAAGQGTELFVTTDNDISPLANFFNSFSSVQKQYLKLCIDTCHIFVAGYDIRTKEQVAQLFDDFAEHDILQHIALIHFNDANKDYATRVDRHAAIGHGYIGVKGLCAVLKQARKYRIPCVLETPGDSYTGEIPWIKENFVDKKKKLVKKK